MAYTTTDLDNIKAAIASGELEVEMEGRRVRYRSITELRTARREIESELAAAAGTKRHRQLRINVCKNI